MYRVYVVTLVERKNEFCYYEILSNKAVLVGFCHSFVVLFIAFYIFGNPPWAFKQVIAVGIINYIYKFVVAVVLTPLLYLGHGIIDNYLGKKEADRMTKEAADKSKSFF